MKGVEPIHHLWYLALNQAWLPLHHIRILSGIIYCLLQACIVSTSLNPYLHLALSFSRNHYQVLFHPIWSVSWIFPSLLCRVDETRTRINVRIPNAAGQPITVLPYVIKKSHINLFWICVRCLSDIFPDSTLLLHSGFILIYLLVTYTHPSVRVVPKNDNNQACRQ